jgi:uncharacterized protein YdeI (YjbR/CyaY-like superfamily)
MAPVVVDPKRVHAFIDPDAFHGWLGRHHDSEPEAWIRIYKVRSGTASITPAEAIEVALCWGWIDGIRKGLDEVSFLQRYSPRTRTSVWSKINVDTVGRLIADGRMTEYGLAQVEAAKADGRWAKAYRLKDAAVPADLQAAIDAVPEARAMFETLSRQNRFSLIFRTESMKTEAGRRKRIASFVDMLRRGETIHPQGKAS